MSPLALDFRRPVDLERRGAALELLRDQAAARATDHARAERFRERHEWWIDPSLDPLKANSTDRAKKPCGGGWLRSQSTGLVVAKRCHSWSCRTCAHRLRSCAAATVGRGVDGLPDGYSPAFLTFTDAADAKLTLPTLGTAWNRTNLALRRSYGMGAYALAVEVQKRGALHIHAVAAFPNQITALMRPAGVSKRSSAQFAWHFDGLVPLVQRLGWGPVCDAQAMTEGANQAAAYVVKSLAGYVAKGANFDGFVHERLRPFRTSRDWPANFGAICSELRPGADPGPWEVVRSTTDKRGVN